MSWTHALWLALLLPTASPKPVDDVSWRRPLGNRNQFPPALLFLALETERAAVLHRKQTFFAIDFAYSNIIQISVTPSESIVVDLESIRLLAQGKVGLGKGFEMGASLPIYYFYAGFLDGFISRFHETFGLPNAVRRREPEDLFRYHYRMGNGYVLGRSTSVSAAGDFTLFIKKSLPVSAPYELAVRAAVKLPTGNRDLLSGSGATDFGIGVAASRVGRRAAGYFNLNAHLLGDPGVPGLRPLNYFAFSVGGDLRLTQNLFLAYEVDHMGQFLHSRLPVLDGNALQLVFGLRYRASERFSYEWRLTEDLSRTSPDFTFGFRWELKRLSRGEAQGRDR